MQDIVTKARAFAVQCHGEQRRKYEDAPYYVHLDRVVGLLRSHGYDAQHVLAAAYLHDVLEDTPTSLPEVLFDFGSEIAELVYWLSDLEQGTRKSRKLMSAWRLSRAPLEAKLIKLADLTDNTPGIVEGAPEFGKVWLAEKATILAGMARVEGTKLVDLPLFKAAAA